MDCPFCQIAAGNDPRGILKQGKYTIVVLSNPRLIPGHTLVIPKRHVFRLSELMEEERKELMDTVIYFQEKILSTFAKGCDITQHYRPFIKDGWTKVSHLHLHLRPRELEDELYQKVQQFEKQMWQALPEEERLLFLEKWGE